MRSTAAASICARTALISVPPRRLSDPGSLLIPRKGRFVGDFADAANKLSRRQYREPFVVPEIS